MFAPREQPGPWDDGRSEFDQLVDHLRRSEGGCGAHHAELVARGFQSDFGWSAAALLTAAREKA